MNSNTSRPRTYGGSLRPWQRELDGLDAICTDRSRAARSEGSPLADEENVSAVVGEVEQRLTALLAELRGELDRRSHVNTHLDGIRSTINERL
jgi:hypothetical protein